MATTSSFSWVFRVMARESGYPNSSLASGLETLSKTQISLGFLLWETYPAYLACETYPAYLPGCLMNNKEFNRFQNTYLLNWLGESQFTYAPYMMGPWEWGTFLHYSLHPLDTCPVESTSFQKPKASTLLHSTRKLAKEKQKTIKCRWLWMN